MKKINGKQAKKMAMRILLRDNGKEALQLLNNIPAKTLAGPLFSFFYSLDESLKLRSTVAMGVLAERLAKENVEESRRLLRRIMWNLNDESGGIGWGSAEAMGEILKRNKTLAKEFELIFFSYIIPGKNFLEHEMLQRGALWGVGTYLETKAESLKIVIDALHGFLDSSDPVKRGYAVRGLINMDEKNAACLPSHIFSDHSNIPMFDGWNLYITTVSEIAGQQRCKREKIEIRKEKSVKQGKIDS